MDILKELHDIRDKVEPSNQQLSFLRDTEKDFWQQLVDSNIRASTIACLWCLKAHLIKKISVAFNKWKLCATITKYESKIDESMSISKTPTSFANSDVSILNPQGTVNKALDNAIAVINRFKSISGDGERTNGFNSSGSLVNPRESEFQSISADLTASQEAMVPQVGRQKHLLELSKTLLDNGKDSETKRQILLQLSHDILDRAKSPGSSPKQPTTNDGGAWNRPKIDQAHAQKQYDSYPGMASIPTDVANRSSLNALKSASQPNGHGNAPFDALFPPEEQYYDVTALSHNHHSATTERGKTPPSRGSSRQRGPAGRTAVVSQDEDFPYLKFRHGSGGDYVKDLVSPTYRAKSASRPTTAPQPTQSSKSRSLSAGRSSAAFASPHYMESQAKRRNISPQEKPRYLISTNASRKKVSSPSAHPAAPSSSVTNGNTGVPKSAERRNGAQHHQPSHVQSSFFGRTTHPNTSIMPTSSSSKMNPSYPRQISPQRIPTVSQQYKQSQPQISMSKLDSTLAAIKSSQDSTIVGLGGGGALPTTNNNPNNAFSSNNSVSSIGGFSNSSRLSGISRTSKGSTNAYRELSVIEYMERRAQGKGLNSKTPMTATSSNMKTQSNGGTTGDVNVLGEGNSILDSTILNSSYEHLDADDIQNHLSLQEAVQSRIQQQQQQQQQQQPPPPSQGDSFVHLINSDGPVGDVPSTVLQISTSQLNQRKDSMYPSAFSPDAMQRDPANIAQRASTSSKKLKSTPKSTSASEKMDKAQMRLLYGDLPDLSDAKKWEKSLRR